MNAVLRHLDALQKERPNPRYELDFGTPVQLLVATILAAQATDARVNQTTPALFARWPDARAFAAADLEQLQEAVRPCGYYVQKAKRVKNACALLVERYDGELPRTVDELVALPGVGRKTAHVVLQTAFGLATGMIVDTHVARVARRLGLTAHDDADDIEADLVRIVPRERWVFAGAALVLHGRYTCTAKAPRCGACVLADGCPRVGVTTASAGL